MMTENTAIAIGSGVVGFLQAIIVLVLMGIRSDIKDIWDRLYNHYHEVECGGTDCGRLHTGNVVIPGAAR